MDPLIIVLIVAVCIFTLVMVAAGIQLILVMQEVKQTLRKVNLLSETLEKATKQVAAPLSGLGGSIDGLKSGLKVAQAFVSWLNKESKK